ncbi:MAG: hypothetical protein GX591_05405 [Planctomycetes bacterium]|nr:hypothetical protein [Planctomycetota bacterium]
MPFLQPVASGLPFSGCRSSLDDQGLPWYDAADDRPLPGGTAMIQCQDCEFFEHNAKGGFGFKCDPFRTIKEPECLTKWQLIKIEQMVQAYQATLDYYRRLAPLQEKMFRVMEREMDDLNESENWKLADDEEEDDDGPYDDEDRWGRPT